MSSATWRQPIVSQLRCQTRGSRPTLTRNGTGQIGGLMFTKLAIVNTSRPVTRAV